MINGAVAFIADIHGNVWALEAVLASIRRRGILNIFNLGDSLYGPLEPAATAERLIESRIPSLRGNQDRILLQPPPEPRHPTLAYTMSQLLDDHVEWLSGQPCTIEYGDFFLCHGTPISDETYLTEAVTPNSVELRRAHEIDRLIPDVAQPFVLCGHSHVPRLIALDDGRLVINPGSIGLPAYSDELPFPHRMESGSAHARYAIVEDGQVDLVAIAYDHRPAAAKARENGREDWATAVETGYAAP